MKVTKLSLGVFRLFNNAEVYIGKMVTAIAYNTVAKRVGAQILPMAKRAASE